VDGVIIAAAFMISPELGLATTIAVVLHEIPQEIGDFSILLYAGFRKKKALMLNFATALTAFAGAIATYILATSMTGLAPILLAFAAGGFIYIATTDLMPELHKHVSAKVSIAQIIVLLCGLLLLYLIKI
jgi:zinc and cadmium transporter